MRCLTDVQICIRRKGGLSLLVSVSLFGRDRVQTTFHLSYDIETGAQDRLATQPLLFVSNKYVV